ncbi:MAG: GNAT family N-acetyltransferase [Gammaproteobacteria bacterium]|nr:GNAT family N-acetyltransferase [Gammaproteobacteria bacterium]
MYEALPEVTLKDGTKVEAGVVVAPDLEWSDRLEAFLAHHDDIWNWQNRELLRCDVGVDVYFYVLHRGGQPVSIMMSAERHGVGIRGHVWTPPAERRNGACSRLQALQMEHFRSRGGRSLAAYTDYNSVAFHLYRKFGFNEVEPVGGHMQYLSLPADEFEHEYFVRSETTIEPLGWRHWPTAPPLFMGDFPGRVRCAPLGLVGRQSTEHPLLTEIHNAQCGDNTKHPRVMVLRNQTTEAIVGLAAWGWFPRHRSSCLLDVYCHSNYWDEAENLLASLPLPKAERYLCYADSSCEQKESCLLAHGFRRSARWRKFPVDLCRAPLARLPRSAIDGQIATTCWTLAHVVDVPVSKCWQGLVGASRASARIPAKWPRFPLTHSLYVNLTLYEN